MSAPGSAKLRLGWFTTANGPGSRGMFEAVSEAIRSGELNAELAFVFVSRERGQTDPTDSFLDLVEAAGIPTVTLSSARFRREHGDKPWATLREAYDAAVVQTLETSLGGEVSECVDVSMMAGYMLFAPRLSRRLRLLNLHPALPGGPTGRWQDAIWQVIEAGAAEHGAVIHVATPQLDRGPVVAYSRFSIRGDDFGAHWDAHWREATSDAGRRRIAARDESLGLFGAIRAAGVDRERPLVVATLRAVADGRVDLGAGKALELSERDLHG